MYICKFIYLYVQYIMHMFHILQLYILTISINMQMHLKNVIFRNHVAIWEVHMINLAIEVIFLVPGHRSRIRRSATHKDSSDSRLFLVVD